MSSLDDAEKIEKLGKKLGKKEDELKLFIENGLKELAEVREHERTKERAALELQLSVQRENEFKAQERARGKDDSEQRPDSSIRIVDSNTKKVNAKNLPKLPMFNEKSEDLSAFLTRFERQAKIRQWERGDWATYLSGYLQNSALECYNRLTETEAEDYDVLKKSLMKRYQYTEEEFRKKFRNERIQSGESYEMFRNRLDYYLTKYIELADGTVNKETSLWDLSVKEQLLEACPLDLKVFIKEQGKTNSKEASLIADRFLEAREKKRGQNTHQPSTSGQPQHASQDPRKQDRPPLFCSRCNKRGHSLSSCRNSGNGGRRFNNQ